ncbi:protein DPCD isoform X2 [Pseudomyrmex gracilis]|uniref:protein DPCD isoform X2 n=1 Tax=Pseudomyrmex gracilis TaxID=219809 RepID=UPI000994B627|nr:protein DPCD isoform X2 [Pseudomyrmex gracilis]
MTPDSWVKAIENAQKTASIEENGKEMVEEYSTETNVVLRRAWKEKNKFGKNIGWVIEVGVNGYKPNNIELYGIQESSNMPYVTRRITKLSLEWNINNLPYPQNVYSVTAGQDGSITVRTSNKKYFKKIQVPDLERIGLKPEQERISFQHRFNTLIITYKKPPELIDVEKKILNMVLQLETDNSQCPVS